MKKQERIGIFANTKGSPENFYDAEVLLVYKKEKATPYFLWIPWSKKI